MAFTIEYDNEFEHQMPHRTTRHGSTAGARHAPWLVSMAMWANCMQYVPDDGVSFRELARRARIANASMRMVLTRMSGWWGYVVVEPDPADRRPKPPRPDWLVRPTQGGRRAQEVWRPPAAVIEQRWRERSGHDQIDQLRGSLSAVTGQLEVDLPEYLPVGVARLERRPAGNGAAVEGVTLPALLSKVLLAYAIEFEPSRGAGGRATARTQ